MDEIERRLRPDTAPVEERVDVEGGLAVVLARGRRRLVRRRFSVALFAVALVVVGLATVARSPSGRSDLESIGAPDPPEEAPLEPTSTSTPPPPSSTASLAEETPGTESTAVAAGEDGGRPERVELAISVHTNADRYETGETVTVDVDVCNTADRDAVEYFADPDSMFRVRIVVAEDDRTVALGFHPRDGDAVQTWAVGECRRYEIMWDQTEGEFGHDSGAPAWPDSYTAQVDWMSVDPPPDGMDPGLYDPAMPTRAPAVSPVFRIDPPPSDNGPMVPGGL